MRLDVRTVGLLGAVLAFAACTEHASVEADAAHAHTGRRTDAIQGGSADTTSTFAVAVVDDQDSVCSGTLIAPNLVLTARHCVALDDGGATVDCDHDQFSAPSAASSLRVSTDADATFATAKLHAAKIIVPTETAFCGHDLALIVLKENVPASVATPATPALVPPHATKLTAIGYGITAPNASDDGTRRKRAGIDIACIPGDKTLDCDPADFGMTAAELAAGDGLCDGDSGSGAYDPTSLLSAGNPIVMGVLSRAGGTASLCTDAVYGRTDSIAALLVATAKDAAAAGGYAPPAWADPTAAASDAGVVDEGGAPSEDDAGSAPDSSAMTPASSSTTETSSCAMARAPRHRASLGTQHLALVIACAFGTLAARRRRRRHAPSS